MSGASTTRGQVSDARASDGFDARAVEAELALRCRTLVERALELGANEAEAYGTSSRTIGVRFEKGDLKLAQVDESTSIGLRVFREKRLGFSSTNQTDERSLDATARDALALTRCSPPDEHNRLPAARAIAPLEGLVEPALAALPIGTVVDHALDLVARVRAFDPRLSIDNAGCEVARATHAIAASTGVEAAESDARIGLQVFGMALDGAEVGGVHYEGDDLRRLADVEPALARIAGDFCRTTLGNLGAGRAESYRGPVLFSPDAVLALFASPLCSAASAIAVQRGRSALAGKVGEPIAVEGFDLLDDPTDRSLAGATAFDREGQPAGRFPIVARGRLASHLYNGYAAAVDGRASTGHARGGPRGTPGLGPHAVVVGAGDGGDLAALSAKLGRGLYVERFSGTIDAASGDFSGVAKSARWIESGESVRSLRETLISGNVFDLLRRIVALGSTSERCFGSARAPAALVDGLSVTAG